MLRVKSPIAAAFVAALASASLSIAAPSASSSVKAPPPPAPKPSASTKPAAPPPSAKPAPTPAPAPKPKPKEPAAPSKPVNTPNTAAQKSVAGGPSANDSTAGGESSELQALHDAEIDLFAGAAPSPGKGWPSDLPSPPKGPYAMTGGLPPSTVENPSSDVAVGSASLAWLDKLKMPDLPVRWDARVVRYLEFFKDDPRGRRIFTLWWKRAGKYRALIQDELRAKSMPEDLAWVAMAESGFDPTIKSPVGAAGLWQFMPEAAKVYGLSIDRWADGRTSPLRSTEAAIAFLGDLKKRFGTWELALAAYNMGYGGALAVVKKFNSNDYWELSRLENGLPWETTLYVPKIVAMAIVARNPDVFGYDGVAQEAPMNGERVEVPAGAEVKTIAEVAKCTVKEIESLNPELRAGRVPPATVGKNGGVESNAYVILVPTGRAQAVKDGAAKLTPKSGSYETYVVRFGETLDLVASTHKTTKAKLVELNAISKDESVRAGTVLLVPPLPAGTKIEGTPIAVASADKPTVVVPPTTFAYADRQRLFYRVVVGDTVAEIASAFGVSVDDLRTWNAIDPDARLQEGMTLQIFAPKKADLAAKVVAMTDADVKVIAVGSDEFYAMEEAAKGKKRITVFATGGETLEALGKKYGVTASSMEKINRRPRSDKLGAGEAVIVYVDANKAPKVAALPAASPAPKPASELPALGETKM